MFIFTYSSQDHTSRLFIAFPGQATPRPGLESAMWLLVLAFVAISYGQVVDRPDQVIVAPLFGDDIQPLGLEANAIDAFSNLTGYPITMFKSRTSQVRSGRAPPTNAWWMDMVLHNLTTAVVSQYPLMVRAAWHTCSLEVSKMAPVVCIYEIYFLLCW